MSSADETTSGSPRKLPPERPGQPGGKRDQNRRKRRRTLRAAAIELFLERGVDGVTIDDIARAAGTAKGNFYRYFDDKEALVAAIFEPVAEGVRHAMDACEEALVDAHDETSLYAAYQTLGLAFIPIAIGEPDVVRLYLQESRAPSAGARAPIRALADEIQARAIKLTEFAVEHGLLRIPDPRVSALAVIGATEQLTHALLNGGLDASPPEVAGSLIGLVLDGIRVRPT